MFISNLVNAQHTLSEGISILESRESLSPGEFQFIYVRLVCIPEKAKVLESSPCCIDWEMYLVSLLADFF